MNISYTLIHITSDTQAIMRIMRIIRVMRVIRVHESHGDYAYSSAFTRVRAFKTLPGDRPPMDIDRKVRLDRQI